MMEERTVVNHGELVQRGGGGGEGRCVLRSSIAVK